MKPQIYALGIGRFTPVCMELAEACGYEIAGLWHYDGSRTGEAVYGSRILGSFADLWALGDLGGKEFVLTMGDADARAEAYSHIKELNGSCPNLVHPGAVVSRFASIADGGIHIGPFSHVQANARIGEDTMVMSHVNISHDAAIGNHCNIAGLSCVSADTVLEDYVVFGINAKTIPGRMNVIGEHSLIGAGSLVTGRIPPRSTVKGHLAEIQTPEPLVSVIVTTFNHEKYIQECIDSILSQKCSFIYEILVHDDASSDRTPEILKEYSNLHPEIIKVYCATENQSELGRDPWVDILFPKAKGKYLAICDGDDHWTDPYKLQHQVDILSDDSSLAGCAGNIDIVDSEGTFVESRKILHDGRYTLKKMLQEGICYPTSTVVLRNSNMADITRLAHIMKNRYLADWTLWIATHIHGDFQCTQEVLAAYRMNPTSITHNDASKRRLGLAKDNFRLNRQIIGILPDRFDDVKSILKDKTPLWLNLAKAYKHNGCYIRMAWCLFRYSCAVIARKVRNV